MQITVLANDAELTDEILAELKRLKPKSMFSGSTRPSLLLAAQVADSKLAIVEEVAAFGHGWTVRQAIREKREEEHLEAYLDMLRGVIFGIVFSESFFKKVLVVAPRYFIFGLMQIALGSSEEALKRVQLGENLVTFFFHPVPDGLARLEIAVR